MSQLAARLDDRFRLLTGGARTALPRQQTLRAVVEWSYDLLFDGRAARLRSRLPCSPGAARWRRPRRCAPEGTSTAADVADILARLVDKSLVIADRTLGQVRFSLLQTLTLFGRERLAASREGPATACRVHAEHFRAICARGVEAFRGVDQLAWFGEARRELDNIRTAMTWAIDHEDADAALEIAAGIAWTFWLSGGGDEGIRLLDAALACAGPSSPARRARALTWECVVRSNAGTGLDRAVELGEEGIALWAEVDDAREHAEASIMVAGVHVMHGGRARAVRAVRGGVRILLCAP